MGILLRNTSCRSAGHLQLLKEQPEAAFSIVLPNPGLIRSLPSVHLYGDSGMEHWNEGWPGTPGMGGSGAQGAVWILSFFGGRELLVIFQLPDSLD